MYEYDSPDDLRCQVEGFADELKEVQAERDALAAAVKTIFSEVLPTMAGKEVWLSPEPYTQYTYHQDRYPEMYAAIKYIIDFLEAATE